MESKDLHDRLRRGGYRVTRPRLAVWRVLTRQPGAHMTVEEVAERVNAEDPRVNLASVYRSLALFEELELARESRLTGEEAGRWELAHPDEHFHLVCDTCGAIDHHVGALVEQIREHLAGDHGFEPRDIELIVSGRCADCVQAAGATA